MQVLSDLTSTCSSKSVFPGTPVFPKRATADPLNYSLVLRHAILFPTSFSMGMHALLSSETVPTEWYYLCNKNMLAYKEYMCG